VLHAVAIVQRVVRDWRTTDIAWIFVAGDLASSFFDLRRSDCQTVSRGIAYPPSAFLVDWKVVLYFVAGSGRQL
jgi:hypothetical protein